MKLWRFYMVHSLRDMLRNRQRTLFALFCVAAGVAAVVALRMLGLMIADALTTNVAALNRGDIYIRAGWHGDPDEESLDGRTVFTTQSVERIRQWAADHEAVVSVAITNTDLQMALVRDGQPGRPQNLDTYFIEPELYPFYAEIRALDPPGVLLRDMLVGPRDVVVAENIAVRMGIAVGDEVRLSRCPDYFTVRGIVPTESENLMQRANALLFGYVYLSIDNAPEFGLEIQPNEIYVRLPDGADLDRAVASLRSRTGEARLRTREDLLRQNQFLADLVGDFILIMGLAALVVGGVGIINTMLVVVGRRTIEVAVLKTLGMKGGQVTLLFLVEAALLGLLGSLVGLVFGVALSFVAQRVGEQFMRQTLHWQLSWDPLLVGMGMGVTVTTIFGFLPTLAAARVRPAAVLRPNDALLPRAGLLRWMLAMLVLTLVLGIIGAQIVGEFWLGLLLAAAGMATLGMLVALFWVLVWLVGKLPSLGWVDLKLALRDMSTKRSRTASSLLSLTGGVFGLSIITLMSTTVIQVLNFSLTQQLGGNIITTSFLPGGGGMIAATLEGREGVTFTQFGEYRSDLLAINGEQVLDAPGIFNFVIARDVRTAPRLETSMQAGRQLGPEDAGRSVIVIPGTPEVQQMGLAPGDVLRLRLRSFTRSTIEEFEVIGITEAPSFAMTGLLAAGVPFVPLDTVASHLPAEVYATVVNAEEQALNGTLLALGDVPGVLSYEIGSLSAAVERLLQQMAAIPLLVAGLALFAGATIIANTVSLATLERRRQIGIMKALGLKGRRVLGLLLLENAIIGFLGGLVGIGVSALVIWLVTLLEGGFEVFRQSISLEQVVIVMSLSIGIALAATLLTAWGASREKPMNILRYE